MSSSNHSEAYVTLALDDVYSKGARVLGHSLRIHGTTRDLVVLISPLVSDVARATLTAVFDHVICVDVLDSKDEAHLALLKRPELGVTFTKLHCWNLTQYEKCVFMDADTIALTNIDELFNKEEFSAAPDAGWPDMFNSGLFVFCPSRDTYLTLINLAATEGSFDGGDQGLLNTHFSSWATTDIDKHLSFLYNMHSTATYTYSPAFARFGKDTKVVHFIGAVKPWHHKYDRENDVVYQTHGQGIHEERFIKAWWRLYWQCEDQFNGELYALSSNEGSKHHQWMWQTSQVDYTGEDKFDNLQAKMDALLQRPEPNPGPSSLSPSREPPKEVNTVVEGENVEKESLKQEDTARDFVRFELWQRGSTDFQGQDSFDNIQAKIDQVLNQEGKTQAVESTKKEEVKSKKPMKNKERATDGKEVSENARTDVKLRSPLDEDALKDATAPSLDAEENKTPKSMPVEEVEDVPKVGESAEST